MKEYTPIADFKNHVGEEVTIAGWCYNKRSSKKLYFIIVRDGSAMCQCVAFLTSLSFVLQNTKSRFLSAICDLPEPQLSQANSVQAHTSTGPFYHPSVFYVKADYVVVMVWPDV